MSKVLIPSGAVVTGALNRTRGTDTQVYVRSAVGCRQGGHDGAENVPAEDRRGMVEWNRYAAAVTATNYAPETGQGAAKRRAVPRA
jgi:hypothetical protein